MNSQLLFYRTVAGCPRRSLFTSRLRLVGFCLLFPFLFAQAQQQQPYATRSFVDRIRTIQCFPEGNPLAPPMIALGGPERLTIAFDELLPDASYFNYKLIHCNADWRQSALSELEYLDGFNVNPIDTYEFSQSTFTNYVHYSLSIPNENVRPLVSGNYVLQVFPENEPDRILMQVCFSIYESLVSMGMEVSSRTDIDYNASHQQVGVTVNAPNYTISNPYQELKLIVTQNGRRDNQATVVQPLSAQGSSIQYQHLRSLIFEAGNEYRRFEDTNIRYAGMGVQNIQFFDPYYNVTLFTGMPRKNSGYSYDQTQYGGYIIRESNAENSDIEADYFIVHFSLEDTPFADGRVFINGDLTLNLFNEDNEMFYNAQERKYEKALLLKQGAYNYQYLYLPNGRSQARTGAIEGNYYQTVNEYLARLYHRPQGGRYDRLIGVGMVYSGR